jgi:hypothetical protein
MTHNHISVSSETPPTWRARSPYSYPSRTGWPSINPRALGSLYIASYDSQDWDGGILIRLYMGNFKLFCDRRSVAQSALVSSPHLGSLPRFLLMSDICGLHAVGRPPWREDGSVIYSYNSLSLFGPRPSELMTTSVSFETTGFSFRRRTTVQGF